VDTVLVSGKEKVKKPDREIFIRAAKRLGVDVSEGVFVGDNPRTDVGGAASVGMKTVWVKRYRLWPESLVTAPHYTITNLTDWLSGSR
jgi:putative hydrolase of the HAD superfamily